MNFLDKTLIMLGQTVSPSELLTNNDKTNEGINSITDTVKGVGGSGLNVIQTLAVFLAAGAFIFAAFKLMFSAGNANKSSEAKSGIVQVVIAIVLIFAAAGIVIWAANIGSTLFPSGN